MDLIKLCNLYYKLCTAQKSDALQYLDQGLYAHFSDTPHHFGINPNRHKQLQLTGGPNGIYAYEWKRDMLGGQMKFAVNRVSVVLFYPTNPDKILDIDKYSDADFQQDLVRLRSLVEPLLVETALKRHDKYTGKFDKLKATLSSAFSLPAGKLYYIISKLEDRDLFDPEEDIISYHSPGTYNPEYAKKVFQLLGYTGFTDRHGVIQTSEPYQTVFFDPSELKVIGAFQNPLGK